MSDDNRRVHGIDRYILIWVFEQHALLSSEQFMGCKAPSPRGAVWGHASSEHWNLETKTQILSRDSNDSHEN